MPCGASHPTYRKVFCERMIRCGYGTSHTARGPREFWITWDDESTRRRGFWEMIQRLTDRAKARQRQEDLRHFGKREALKRERLRLNSGD